MEDSIDVFDIHREQLISFQNYEYEPGKWTPKDLLQHVIDTERVQAYRALAFARNDQNVMAGYDENAYAKNVDISELSMDDLLTEFKIVRRSTIALFSNFSDDMLLKEGVCFKIKVSVRSLGLILIGHPIHHVKVLETRYFKSVK